MPIHTPKLWPGEVSDLVNTHYIYFLVKQYMFLLTSCRVIPEIVSQLPKLVKAHQNTYPYTSYLAIKTQ